MALVIGIRTIEQKCNFPNVLTVKIGKTDVYIVDSGASEHMIGMHH